MIDNIQNMPRNSCCSSFPQIPVEIGSQLRVLSGGGVKALCMEIQITSFVARVISKQEKIFNEMSEAGICVEQGKEEM